MKLAIKVHLFLDPVKCITPAVAVLVNVITNQQIQKAPVPIPDLR